VPLLRPSLIWLESRNHVSWPVYLQPELNAPCHPPTAPSPSPSLQLQEESNMPTPYSDVKFSSDGKYLLGVVEGRVYVMDAFNGTVVRKWVRFPVRFLRGTVHFCALCGGHRSCSACTCASLQQWGGTWVCGAGASPCPGLSLHDRLPRCATR
jgi:hypothetical protein